MVWNVTLEEAKKSLEEEIELSNVTDLRQDLLPVIGRITQNPLLRVLILKHGRPQAVLMSAQTYDLLKKVINLFLTKADEMTQQEKIEAALNRLIAERPSVAGHPSAVSERLSAAGRISGSVVKHISEPTVEKKKAS